MRLAFLSLEHIVYMAMKLSKPFWLILPLLCIVMAVIAAIPSYEHKYFANRQQLAQSDLIKKGWVPEFIPEDASAIHVYWSLDTNTVLVRYQYAKDFMNVSHIQPPPKECSTRDDCNEKLVALGFSNAPSPHTHFYILEGDGEMAGLNVNILRQTAEYRNNFRLQKDKHGK